MADVDGYEGAGACDVCEFCSLDGELDRRLPSVELVPSACLDVVEDVADYSRRTEGMLLVRCQQSPNMVERTAL